MLEWDGTHYVVVGKTGDGVVVRTANPTLASPALTGYLEIANSNAPSTPTGASRLFVDALNRLGWKGANGFVRTFDGTANTADRIYVLPDAAGTLALTTSDITTMATLTPGSSIRNVVQPSGDFIGLTVKGFSTGQASLIAKLQKSDGAGFFQVDAAGKVQVQGDQTLATLGAELLTDGDFATDPTGIWTYSSPWSWSSNKMAFAGGTGPVASALINYGGTGYTAGDVITLTNGANDATLTVLTVSSGAIATFSILSAGTACTVNASVAVTGGTGSGALIQIVRLSDSASVLSQSPTIVASSVYQVVYTVSSRTAGELLVTLGGTSGSRINANGTYTQVVIATDTTGLIFTATADFVGSIDDISLKLISTSPAQMSALNSDSTTGFELRAGGTGLNNTFAGLNAGSSAITGSNNNGVGVSALRRNTTGSSNTASGVNALEFNTIGNSNTASGVSALRRNITGSNNVAVGTNVLTNNITGGSNVGVGSSALLSNTTGGSNVGVGLSALQSNTTGSNSVAVGLNALRANIAGSSNVAVGSSAMLSNTIGTLNVAAGAGALQLNVTGSSNTASGASAMLNNTTGGSNTASGAGALQRNTTGGSNVAVGNNALSNNLTGGSNIGVGASAGLLETGSNKLYIAISGTTTPLIWGDFANLFLATSGSLGVKTQNPTAVIDAIGTTAASSAFVQKLKQTGAELITVTADRDFSGANNWTGTNWAITSAAYLHTAGSTADAVLANTNLTTAQIISGEMYLVVFTVGSCTAGTVTPKLGTAVGTAVGVNGTYSQWIVAAANNANLIFTPTTDFNGSIDNISVKRLALLMSVDNTGSAKHWIQDAGTNAVVNALQVGRNSTASVTTNFGSGVLGVGQSDTTVDRSMARWRWFWTTATDASRKARAVFSAFDTAERDALAIEASGSAAMIGFLGAPPVIRQTTYTQTYSTTVSTVNPSSTSAFTGQDNLQVGSVYAKLADLNTLRTDMLQLAGLINKQIDDGQAYGLAG